MKVCKISIIGLVIGIILIGCNENEITTSMKTEQLEDISTEEEIVHIDEDTKKWIETMVEQFTNTQINISEGEMERGYHYYLQAKSVLNTLGNLEYVVNSDLKQDLENLFLLASIISHEQFVRTAHIDPNGNAKEQLEYMNEWKPVNERMERSFYYMQQILNDLNVAIHAGSEGGIFEVTHLLNGSKLYEMESFMNDYSEVES